MLSFITASKFRSFAESTDDTFFDLIPFIKKSQNGWEMTGDMDFFILSDDISHDFRIKKMRISYASN